ELERVRQMVSGRKVWLAASTHHNEELIAAHVHETLLAKHKGLLTVIVPRHPQRLADILAQLEPLGLEVAIRSRGDEVAENTDIYIADTMGELGIFYRVSPIAFIGGSLSAKGGQNPLEAARLGCAVITGFDTS